MNNRETELRFADLFAMLLKAFVPIICITLIVGILGGVYGMYSITHKKATVTRDQVSEARLAFDQANSALRKAERALFNRNNKGIPQSKERLEQYERLVKRRQEYIDKSEYQKLNAFNCGVSYLTFYIQTDFTVEPEVAGLAEDPRTTIAMAYSRVYLFDDEIANQLRKIMNSRAEKQYLQELIRIRTVNDRFVEISALNNDSDIAEKVVRYLFKVLQDRLKDQVAPHTANIISTYTAYEVNWDLYETQMQKENELMEAMRLRDNEQETLATLEDTVGEKEQDVEEAKIDYDAAEKNLKSLQAAYENPAPSKKSVLKNGVKFGLIGLVAGLVLGCVIVLAVKLMNGKLHNQTEAKSRYPFPLIGVLPRTKRVTFENTVRKLEGESLGSYEAEAQATAQSLMTRIGDRSVCLVSTLGAGIAEKLAAFTDGKTPVVGNILTDAQAIKALDGYDGVVLVEQRGKSRMNQIDSEVLRMKALDKEIVGIVLI